MTYEMAHVFARVFSSSVGKLTDFMQQANTGDQVLLIYDISNSISILGF